MDPYIHDGDMIDLSQRHRPRKRMRKGTRSCTECRRRKTRCTSDPSRPGTCRECGLRGTICVEQEQDSRREDQQPYSLRERVVQLETVVQTLLRRLDAVDGGSDDAGDALARPLVDAKGTRPTNGVRFTEPSAVTDGFESTPTNERIMTAPVLRLFDNDVVSRRGRHPSHPLTVAPRPASAARARAARTALLSLLPPPGDLTKLVESSLMWWSAWQTEFPAICPRCRDDVVLGQSLCDEPMSPAEAARALLCLVLSVEQLPGDFDYAGLSIPFALQEWTDHRVAAVERLVIGDDEFASTLAGIESHVLLGKYYIHQGRLRKAWLTVRRAIEFAQLTGVHWCATRPQVLPNQVFDRRLEIWCAAATLDRFLSLILGLPYAVPDAFLLPQVTVCLQSGDSPPAYTYMARLALVLGKLVDRDQGLSEQSISKTLLLDEELADMIKNIPERWWRTPTGEDRTMTGRCFETAILHFLHQVVRAFAHLPYILKYAADPKSQCCRLTALESARESLLAYREFRAANRPYLYRLMDFLAFTMAMVLVVHSVGYSGMPTPQLRGPVSQDLDLVRATTEILVQAGTGNGGTVASESSRILQDILDHWAAGSGTDPRRSETLRIALPYFGAITIYPGKAFTERLQRETTFTEPVPRYREKNPLGGERHRTQSDLTSTEPPLGYSNTPSIRLDDVPSFPVPEWEVSGLFDDIGHGLWPGLDLNQGLDQGW